MQLEPVKHEIALSNRQCLHHHLVQHALWENIAMAEVVHVRVFEDFDVFGGLGTDNHFLEVRLGQVDIARSIGTPGVHHVLEVLLQCQLVDLVLLLRLHIRDVLGEGALSRCEQVFGFDETLKHHFYGII